MRLPDRARSKEHLSAWPRLANNNDTILYA